MNRLNYISKIESISVNYISFICLYVQYTKVTNETTGQSKNKSRYIYDDQCL